MAALMSREHREEAAHVLGRSGRLVDEWLPHLPLMSMHGVARGASAADAACGCPPDAIGRARGGADSMGGYDEREQTLNQILTEMDGFTGNEGVWSWPRPTGRRSWIRRCCARAGSTGG